MNMFNTEHVHKMAGVSNIAEHCFQSTDRGPLVGDEGTAGGPSEIVYNK